jgi:hypothetical protein
MSGTHKKIELIANIAIILVAIVLGGVLVKKFLLTDSAPTPTGERSQPQVGAKANLPDTDFSAKDKTLLLAMKKDCRFCTDSVGFYRKLTAAADEKNVRVIAVFPHSVEMGQIYLKEINLAVPEFRQADFTALGVGGTPTLILTDNTGEIKKFWVGQLPPEKEKEVLDSLQ